MCGGGGGVGGGAGVVFYGRHAALTPAVVKTYRF